MKKLFILPLLAALVIGCTEKPGNGKDDPKDDPTEVDDYVITEFDSCDMPEVVPFNGGEYTLKLKTHIETKAVIFGPWQYRIDCGNESVQSGKVTEETTEISFAVKPNYDVAERKITIYFKKPFDLTNSIGDKVYESVQESAMTEMGQDGISYFYAKTNLTVKDEKFALADKVSDPGHFFSHESVYGVPADNRYQGFAYKPEKVEIALSDIEYGKGEDPCNALSPALRLPSQEELNNMLANLVADQIPEKDGVKGVSFAGSDLFLPFSGYINVEMGTLLGDNSYTALWGLGSDIEGNGNIYVVNTDYQYVYVDFERKNLASVRCVRNIPLPFYVSHTPANLPDYSATTVEVTTNHGDYHHYTVSAIADDGRTVEAIATDGKATTTLKIPANNSSYDRIWYIYVNGIKSEGSFVQPCMKDYVKYFSHTPTAPQGSGAFVLKVTCDSDKDEFMVSAACGSESYSETGSKDKLTVSINIPENTSADKKVWEILIDGQSTGKSVEQAKASVPGELSVVWSEGYLTVKDGAYTFASPTERGAYFKWQSKWAIVYENPTSTSTFPGKAYGPDETAYSTVADIPYGDADPCALVAPAGTWRTPSVADFNELFTCDWVLTRDEGNKHIEYTLADGKKLTFWVSGQLNGSTEKFTLFDSSSLVWTNEASTSDSTKGLYYLQGYTSTSTPKVTAGGTAKTNGAMVRCIRNK